MKHSIVLAYLHTALWSSVDDEGNPLDSSYDISDIDQASIEKSSKELDDFITAAIELLEGVDLETAAHDFWLTRNRHGAGFWDGDYPDAIGEALTELSHKFGEVNLYVGDDGKVYIE